VIVLTQNGTIDSAVAATSMGAIDYITKPFRIEELRAAEAGFTSGRTAAGKVPRSRGPH
jgi:DNA-binding NtrC family response regulator